MGLKTAEVTGQDGQTWPQKLYAERGTQFLSINLCILLLCYCIELEEDAMVNDMEFLHAINFSFEIYPTNFANRNEGPSMHIVCRRLIGHPHKICQLLKEISRLAY